MNTLAVNTEQIVANDIKISSPISVMSRSGEVNSLSVVKSTDNLLEHNDTVTITNGRIQVNLPMGFTGMEYMVQATPNKLVQVAVTDKTDEYFIIEVNTDEEVTIDYCIKAIQPNYQSRTTYGELQGENPIAITSDKADKPVSEVEYDVAVLSNEEVEAPYFISSKNELNN